MDKNNNNANNNTFTLRRDDDRIDPPVPFDPLVPHCRYCGFEPCRLDTGLYQVIVDYEANLHYSNVSLTNKKVRYHLYRHVTNWIHGYLGKGTCIEIPTCVRGEILNLAPDLNHKYVSFI
jgi:hypothetical protein